MEPISFPYRARLGLILAVVVFFGLCAAVILSEALNPDGPVRLRGLGTFSEASAPTVLWILVALCLCFVAAGLLAALRSREDCRVIRVESDGIEAPRSLVSRKVVRLAWDDITAADITTVQRQTTMTLRAPDDKLVIAQNGMQNPAAFGTLVDIVRARMASPAP